MIVEERIVADSLSELEKRVGKKDGFFLAKYVIGRHWLKGEKEGKAKSLWGPWHEELSRWLWNLWVTRHERPYKTIAVVCWPRRTMKSTIAEGPFPMQVLLNEPNTRILFDSYKIDNARGFLQPVKQAFEGELVREIYGDLRSEGDWNMNTITLKRDSVSPQPSIDTSGLDASTTSQHYELIIADDLQVAENSKNQEQIDKVIERVKLYDNLLDQSGMAVIVGTRWAFGDVMEFLDDTAAEDKRYGRPQRIFVNKKSAYKRGPDGKFTKELEFPGLLTHEELNYARSSQGAFLFSCNYLVEPMSDETAMFKKEWLLYHSMGMDEFPKGTRCYMAIDPAGEGTFASADYNAIIVAAVTPSGDIYVLHRVRAHMTRQALMEKIYDLYKIYKPSKVGIETIWGQVELKNWMKSELRKQGKTLPWHEFKNSTEKKEARVRSLQPFFECGKIFLRPDMTDLEQEILQFPKAAHDDIVDCLAYILDMMDVPKGEAAKDWWKQRDWALTGAFKPTEAMPTPPDATTLRVWAAEDRLKTMKTKRKHSFTPLSRKY